MSQQQFATERWHLFCQGNLNHGLDLSTFNIRWPEQVAGISDPEEFGNDLVHIGRPAQLDYAAPLRSLRLCGEILSACAELRRNCYGSILPPYFIACPSFPGVF